MKRSEFFKRMRAFLHLRRRVQIDKIVDAVEEVMAQRCLNGESRVLPMLEQVYGIRRSAADGGTSEVKAAPCSSDATKRLGVIYDDLMRKQYDEFIARSRQGQASDAKPARKSRLTKLLSLLHWKADRR